MRPWSSFPFIFSLQEVQDDTSFSLEREVAERRVVGNPFRIHTHWLPRWCSGKDPPANAGDTGDMGSSPGSGISPGEENGNPLQYSCQGNFMDRGAWWAMVHGVSESDMTEGLSTNTC